MGDFGIRLFQFVRGWRKIERVELRSGRFDFAKAWEKIRVWFPMIVSPFLNPEPFIVTEGNMKKFCAIVAAMFLSVLVHGQTSRAVRAIDYLSHSVRRNGATLPSGNISDITSEAASGVRVANNVEINDGLDVSPAHSLNVTGAHCGVSTAATDNSAAFTVCGQYAIGHNLPLYIPAGKYNVTHHINWTCSAGYNIKVYGEGKNSTRILHNLVKGEHVVIDIGGCSHSELGDFSVLDVGTSAAIAGILDSNGIAGPSWGGGTTLTHMNIQAGKDASTCAICLVGVDLMHLSDVDANRGAGYGTGLLWGNTIGHATSLVSDVYGAVPNGRGSVTDLFWESNIIGGDFGPAVQETGSSMYWYNGGYAFRVGAGKGVVPGVIDVVGPAGYGLVNNCESLWTENQSRATGLSAFYYEVGTVSGADCRGGFNTDPAGATIGGAANLTFSKMRWWDASEQHSFLGFAPGAAGYPLFYNGDLTFSYSTFQVTTPGSAQPNFQGTTVNARSVPCSTLQTLGGSNSVYLGINGCKYYTDMTLVGVEHEAGSSPKTSTGTLRGTNAGGFITGLSAVTSVMITFANGGWTNWAACTANASGTAQQPYISSTPGLKTSVTFAFPSSYTGALTYHCDGN